MRFSPYFLLVLAPIFSSQSIKECPILKPRDRPNEVKDLRPDDIAVVMALGDSLTTGFGMKYKRFELSVWKEYRGSVFSIGGDENEVTVPNFIKHFNPNVYGASLGEHLVSYCSATFCPPSKWLYKPEQDKLNAALSGSSFTNLDLEIDYLIKNYQPHNKDYWKLISIMSGNNDLCKYSCTESELGDADYFELVLEASIKKLKQQFNRTIINLISLPDISQLKIFFENEKCRKVQYWTKSVCPCLFTNPSILKSKTVEFNRRLMKISEKYKEDKEFAIRLMPIFSDYQVKDDSYLSELDCFHPSEKTHQIAAAAMWNNLFVKKESRSNSFNETESLYCPTEQDRIML